MKVKIFPVEGCAGILKAALKRDDGTVTRWVGEPWPVVLDVTDEELRNIGRAQTIQCAVIGAEEKAPEPISVEPDAPAETPEVTPEATPEPADERTITIGTLANKAGEGIGPARIIEVAAELGITLDRKSHIPVSQAEAILAHLRGE